ncbi:MAG: amidophosphoribosyltransferase [archaeon]
MCGILGVYNSENASYYTYLGLFALQHRGQEGAGIASMKNNEIKLKKNLGLVQEIFPDEKSLESLEGRIAIGGNRYSTINASGVESIQPLVFSLHNNKKIATVHNGNISNYKSLRQQLEKKGSIFQTDIDSEIFAHLIARAKGKKLQTKIKNSFQKIIGAYSLVIMAEDELIAIRDPWGFRPLQLGKKDDSYIISSETCGFDIMDAKDVRDIEPGEIVTIGKNGVTSQFLESKPSSSCIFEYIYFARPDSRVLGKNFDKYRRQLGKNLAIEHPVEADMIISVPDSGNTAALGYAQEIGIPYDIGLIRNHYVGRTFIKPSQTIRDLSVKKKLNPVSGLIEGKRIVIVDDSIVRGTTMKKLTRILRENGVKEIHVRISSPPIEYPCYYGMDFPTQEELFVHNPAIRENKDMLSAMERHLDVESLRYLSLDGLLASVPSNGYCTSCFTGKYPTAIEF